MHFEGAGRNQELSTTEGALAVHVLFSFLESSVCGGACTYTPVPLKQPYIAPTPTPNWRPTPIDRQAITPSSKVQFSDPSTPAEAVRLVREQNLHFAFDDHLEDVTIGELYLFSMFLLCELLALLTCHF